MVTKNRTKNKKKQIPDKYKVNERLAQINSDISLIIKASEIKSKASSESSASASLDKIKSKR